MADKHIATIERSSVAAFAALAAKSKAVGLDVRVIVEVGTQHGGVQDISDAWACIRADQFSQLLNPVVANPARHQINIAGSNWGTFPSDSTLYSAHRPIHHHLESSRQTHFLPGRLLEMEGGGYRTRPYGKQHHGKPDHLVVLGLESIASAFANAEMLLGPISIEESGNSSMALLERHPKSDRIKKTPKDVLKDKAIAAFIRLVDKIDDDVALQALSAPDEVSTLVTFLALPEVAKTFAEETNDPLAAATARGIAQRKVLLEAEGGTASGQEMADLLGITRQAVDKRRKNGTLLAIPTGSNDWRYPRWQLHDQQILPGFDRVMKAFEGRGSWTRFHFLLSPNERLDGQRPLDALRSGNIDKVVEAIVAQGEQGGR